MALIKCPECEKEISNKIGTTCPNCGYKFENQIEEKPMGVKDYLVIALFVVPLVFLFCLTVC